MRKLGGILLVLFMVLLVACGPSTTQIETAASDMNLAAGDLGSGYEMSEEEGLDEVIAGMDPDEAEDAEDANLRMFTTPDGMGMVMSVVVNFKTVAAAKANMRGVMDGFEEGFNDEMPGTEFAELDDPNIGDESILIGADLGDLGFQVYMLSFRKDNVMGLLAVFGMTGSIDEAMVVEMGKTLEGKIK